VLDSLNRLGQMDVLETRGEGGASRQVGGVHESG
jgi:hypothetical protein